MAGLQVVINAGALLGMYTYVRSEVGVEVFGVWSLVVGVTLSVNLAEFGISGAALRYVADAVGREALYEATEIAETAVVSALFVMAGMALVLYLPLHLGLVHLMDGESPEMGALASHLLPRTLLIACLTAVSASCLNVLDGTQQVHFRGGLAIAGTVVLVLLALWLVPRMGVFGFLWAQTGQMAFLAVAAWARVRRSLPGVSLLPVKWSASHFRRLIGYGVQWQFITLLSLFADPLAKMYISQTGGLAYVGTYEFASKAAVQIRNVFASLQMALLPALTRVHAEAPGRLREVYTHHLRASVLVVAITFPAAAALSPVLGWIWAAPTSSDVSLIVSVLLAGWGVNLLSNPAYHELAARGNLWPNVAGHALFAGLNAILGFLLTRNMGGIGAVIGISVSLAAGSLLTIALHALRHGQGMGNPLRRVDWIVVLAGAAGGLVLHRAVASGPHMALLVGILYGAIAGAVLWQHPVRHDLLKVLRFSPAAS